MSQGQLCIYYNGLLFVKALLIIIIQRFIDMTFYSLLATRHIRDRADRNEAIDNRLSETITKK